MCFERYVLKYYPDMDWSRVDELMWELCDDNDFFDVNTDVLMEIIPRYLYESDNYEILDFIYLTKEDFEYYRTIIPTHIKDPNLDTIMYDIDQMAWVNCFTKIYDEDSWEYIDSIIEVMNKLNIELPDINLVSQHSFSEFGGLGKHFNGRLYSIILSEKDKHKKIKNRKKYPY